MDDDIVKNAKSFKILMHKMRIKPLNGKYSEVEEIASATMSCPEKLNLFKTNIPWDTSLNKM